jgi:hypothetical protein
MLGRVSAAGSQWRVRDSRCGFAKGLPISRPVAVNKIDRLNGLRRSSDTIMSVRRHFWQHRNRDYGGTEYALP